MKVSSKIKSIIQEEVQKALKETMLPQVGYMEAMQKQLKRAKSVDDVRWVAQQHDIIMDLLRLPPEKVTPQLRDLEPFTKFHYRKARQDMLRKNLDPNKAVSGSMLVKQEINRRAEAKKKKEKAAQQKASASTADLDPGQRERAQLRAVYGGEPDELPAGRWGLGS